MRQDGKEGRKERDDVHHYASYSKLYHGDELIIFLCANCLFSLLQNRLTRSSNNRVSWSLSLGSITATFNPCCQ